MNIKEKLINVWKVVKEAYSAVAVGFITIILGIGLSFVGRRKNLQDDREPEDRVGEDTEQLRRNTEELRGTTDRLSENNNRLRKLLEGLEEEEIEE